MHVTGGRGNSSARPARELPAFWHHNVALLFLIGSKEFKSRVQYSVIMHQGPQALAEACG